MLEILGLDQWAEQAYFAVLDHPRSTTDELRARTGIDPDVLAGSLTRLGDHGLIARLPDLATPPSRPSTPWRCCSSRANATSGRSGR